MFNIFKKNNNKQNGNEQSNTDHEHAATSTAAPGTEIRYNPNLISKL